MIRVCGLFWLLLLLLLCYLLFCSFCICSFSILCLSWFLSFVCLSTLSIITSSYKEYKKYTLFWFFFVLFVSGYVVSLCYAAPFCLFYFYYCCYYCSCYPSLCAPSTWFMFSCVCLWVFYDTRCLHWSVVRSMWFILFLLLSTFIFSLFVTV